MTNPTDPRVEAAARVIHRAVGGDYRSGVSQHHAATHWQPLPKTP